MKVLLLPVGTGNGAGMNFYAYIHHSGSDNLRDSPHFTQTETCYISIGLPGWQA